MNLCSIKLARSIWLVPVDDFNPRGRYLYDVIGSMVQRYSFAQAPTLEDAVREPDKLAFVQGSFQNRNDERIAVTLNIHSDGLVVDTGSSTQDCDDFLEELLDWFRDEFGFEDRAAFAVKKVYVSELYFNMHQSQYMVNPVLEQFLQSLPSKIVGHGDVIFEVNGISFGADPEGRAKPVSFRIERADNIPFSENRYYSIGPFQTETHLNLLQELESVLST